MRDPTRTYGAWGRQTQMTKIMKNADDENNEECGWRNRWRTHKTKTKMQCCWVKSDVGYVQSILGLSIWEEEGTS